MFRCRSIRTTLPALGLLLFAVAPTSADAGGRSFGHDPELLAAYDADEDGELSRDERRSLVFGENDADGDGLLSPDEWQAMQDAREARRTEHREKLVAEYDADGDGELSREERHAARESGAFHGKRRGGCDERRRDSADVD